MRGRKYTVLLAVSRDPDLVMRWWRYWTNGGTTLERFQDSIKLILDDLHQNPQTTGGPLLFMMGNLIVHKHAAIVNMIYNAGHRLVYRTPYWPINGAIEYVFNTI